MLVVVLFVDDVELRGMEQIERVIGRKRGRPKGRSKRSLLEELVRDLDAKQDDTVKALEGTVQWGQFDKTSPWLPCVVVPMSKLHAFEDLQLAKATLTAKRKSVIVHWAGYGIIGKISILSLQPFDPLRDPNDELESPLSDSNREFIRSAVEEIKRAKGNPIDLIRAIRQHGTTAESVASAPNSEIDLEDEAAGEEDTSTAASIGVVTRRNSISSFETRLNASTGFDPLEPAWFDSDPFSKSLGRENSSSTVSQMPAVDDAGASSSSQSASSSDQYSEEEEEEDSEEEDYVPVAANDRKKRRKTQDKRKAKAKPKKRNWTEKMKKDPAKYVKRLGRKLKSISSSNKPEDIRKVLAILRRLAVIEISAKLLEQTKIGTIVMSCRKHENEQVSKTAKALRKIWVSKLKEKL
mmetsp:Transcript_8523/g.13827  ORF Transcript_8523/g.13827 Transcript_8523/m.13827 type:complete len:409 (+) Transcript_8523:221-1447(+)|eukprot:CAMPEP_0203771516 /NCGR_PEP_ID=MMETSP0099_2-20121227/3450_1 /ASSEMBLY_ACC=CAM_ASM_000209 /TAXON_ID=96639 /ORGANISM=" , Strain NY0313808BC1" /LENGTH=408 /DNA_ID=CAMNT_0050668853 /DNA_START=511 /DNA_END=1737 /DNA_ORIENTATION=-